MRKIQVKAKYLVVDTETSGVKAWENSIIQLSALALDSELDILSTFNMYVKPIDGSVWDEEAALIHNISLEKLEKDGVSYKELGKEFLKFVNENFDEKPILIGQFLPFDYSFLDKLFDSTFPDAGLFQNILSRNFIDTKSLANYINLKADIEGKSSVFLETSLSKAGGLLDSLGLDRAKYNAHDALSDCYATRDVLEKILMLGL
jgi:DNA polymerase III epsilon subunit-like protein